MHENSRVELVTTQWVPRIEIEYDGRSTNKKNEKFNLAEFVEIRNEKAVGNKLSDNKIKQISLLEPKPTDIPEEEKETEEQHALDLEFNEDNKNNKGEQMGLFN